MENLIIYAFAYLLGSIPFGLVLAKIFAKTDIKNLGSKSIGATNVLRVVKEVDANLAKKLAIATVILDFAKAALPLVVMKNLGFEASVLWTFGVLCVFGHCYSLYLLFEGGKGVATGAGVMAVMLPMELLTALIIWFIVGRVFKISSLASLVALIVFVATSFIYHYEMPIISTHAPVLIISFLVLYKHIPNIKRLLSNKECKVV